VRNAFGDNGSSGFFFSFGSTLFITIVLNLLNGHVVGGMGKSSKFTPGIPQEVVGLSFSSYPFEKRGHP